MLKLKLEGKLNVNATANLILCHNCVGLVIAIAPQRLTVTHYSHSSAINMLTKTEGVSRIVGKRE